MALFDNVQTKDAAPKAAPTANGAETSAKAKSAKAIAWEKARDQILEYIADEKNNVPAEIIEAAKIFRPSFFGISAGGGFAKKEHPAHVEKLFQLLGVKTFEEIKVGATFDEMKAFTVLKVGRKEMHVIGIDLIKKPDDKGAIYMSFDAAKGLYKIEGVGKEPKGWTGYKPAAKVEADAE